MDKHARYALVIGYRQLVPALNLPDPNDRHVLGAAIRGPAHACLTGDCGTSAALPRTQFLCAPAKLEAERAGETEPEVHIALGLTRINAQLARVRTIRLR
jgi:hypothetical protein